MLYGCKTVALPKRQEAEVEVVELKMLRFSLRVTRIDNIRNMSRDSAGWTVWRENTRGARRGGLNTYGKDDGYTGRRMLRMELPGKRKRGRSKRRYKYANATREDMVIVELTEEDAEDRNKNGDGKSADRRSRKKKRRICLSRKQANNNGHSPVSW